MISRIPIIFLFGQKHRRRSHSCPWQPCRQQSSAVTIASAREVMHLERINTTAFQSKVHRPLADRKSQLVHPEGAGTPASPSRGGGYPSWSIQRGSTSMFTSRGVHFCVHFWGVHFCVHFQGVHVHFWGVPCDLSHNALIYHYRMPQCIMGKIHMGSPSPELGRQTDRQTWLKTLPSRTTCAGGDNDIKTSIEHFIYMSKRSSLY